MTKQSYRPENRALILLTLDGQESPGKEDKTKQRNGEQLLGSI